eukprot:g1355.t1
MFNAIGDKDKLRARKVLKGWRIERIVPPNVLDPVWSLVQGWCDANVNRVLVAEGKRPLQAQAHQRQPLPQQRQHQEQQLRALLYHEQVRMGLKPLSLEELRATNPGLIPVLQQAAAAQQRQPAPRLQQQPVYVQQPPMQPLQYNGMSYAPRAVGMPMPAPVPSLMPSAAPMPPQPQQYVAPPQINQGLPPATTAAPAAAKAEEQDDQASELLAMLGGDLGASDEDSGKASESADAGANGPATPSATGAEKPSSDASDQASPESNDVNSLFDILQGVSGGTTPGGTLPSGKLRKFPLTVSLFQAFQGTTSQVQSALAMRDERLVQALHSGWQDKRSGARFSTKEEYEAAVTFDYHITQRDKAVSGASLMRRWYQPWSSWVVHRSPYHVPGNQLRNDSVVEKLRDPYMTEEEAKSISSSGGVDLEAGVMGGQSALAGTAAQLMFDGGGGLNAGEASGGADGTGGRHAGGKMAEGAVGAGSAVGSSGGSGIGADQIPMKEVGEEEGKGCIVCHESFESEFDDASDQWVYKNIRRVPAGLLHATCWSQEAAALPAPTSDVSGSKRALDGDDEEGPDVKRART